MRPEPVWLQRKVLIAAQRQQIAEHGGLDGVRDEGLLESALARPLNLFAYGEPSLTEMAAAYAFGLVRNHPFLDGNKRIAFLAMYVFLARNGMRLTAGEAESATVFLHLAAGEIDEPTLARWIDDHSEPSQPRGDTHGHAAAG